MKPLQPRLPTTNCNVRFSETSRTPFNFKDIRSQKPLYNVRNILFTNKLKEPQTPVMSMPGVQRSQKESIIRNSSDTRLYATNKPYEYAFSNDVSPDKVEPNISDYTIGPQIGNGAYGVVKRGIYRASGKHVAIKIYKKYKLLSSQRKNCVKREIKVMKKMDHPNIVKLYEVIETPKELYLIMELVKGKSLLNYVKSKSGKRLRESDCIKIFSKVVSAICYCHRQNMIHRDIKMDNILLTESFDVKIIDFGFSTWLSPQQKLKIFCGTPSYMPPEIVAKREYYGPPVDIWSLGILLYSMLCGVFPFRGANENELYRNILKGIYSIPKDISDGAKRLISRILKIDPDHRPSADDILKDSYLNNRN